MMTVCGSYQWTWIGGSLAGRRAGTPWIHRTSREPSAGASVAKSIGVSVIGGILRELGPDAEEPHGAAGGKLGEGDESGRREPRGVEGGVAGGGERGAVGHRGEGRVADLDD